MRRREGTLRERMHVCVCVSARMYIYKRVSTKQPNHSYTGVASTCESVCAHIMSVRMRSVDILCVSCYVMVCYVRM